MHFECVRIQIFVFERLFQQLFIGFRRILEDFSFEGKWNCFYLEHFFNTLIKIVQLNLKIEQQLIDIDREYCCFVMDVSECEFNFLNQCNPKLAEQNHLQIHKQFDPHCDNLVLECNEGITENIIDESRINSFVYIPLFILMAILIIGVFYIVIGTITHSHSNDDENYFSTEFIYDNKPQAIMEKVQVQKPPSLSTLKFDMNDSLLSKLKNVSLKTSKH